MSQVTEWIELVDFTPGIWDDWHSAQQLTSDGAAQREGTYSCVGHPAGGLMPAPRMVKRIADSAVIESLISPQFTPPGWDKQFIIGFRNVSPVNSGMGVVQPAYPDIPFLIYANYRDTTGGGGAGAAVGVKIQPKLFKVYLNDTLTIPTSFSPTGVVTSDAGPGAGWPGTIKPALGFGSLDIGRSNAASPTSPGGVVVVYVANSSSDLGAGIARAYPDNTAPTADGVGTVTFGTLTVDASIVIAHQDRFLAIATQALAAGIRNSFGAAFLQSAEILLYTSTNTYGASTCPATGVAFVNENPSGYGSWVSMNASELLLIKQKGGGVIIRGDIANPQITRMPGITSTGEAVNIGTMTPVGYLYGSENGVWLWNGGDTAQNIAPQLDGWFWKTPYMDNFIGAKGSWAFQTPFVFGPNNWLWDMRSSSWWRLSDPNSITDPVINWWDVSANGNVLGAPAFIESGNLYNVFWYDTLQGQSKYSWTSHPLMRGKQKYLNVRQIELVASGTGNIAITIKGLDGKTRTVNFQVTSDLVTHQLEDFELTVFNPILNIVATSLDAAKPAPRILKVGIGTAVRESYA